MKRMKIFALVLCLLALLTTGVCGASAEDGINTYLDAKQGAVHVLVELTVEYNWTIPDGTVFKKGDWIIQGNGSGFFVGPAGENPQYMITNWHVINMWLEYKSGALTTYDWQYKVEEMVEEYVTDEEGNILVDEETGEPITTTTVRTATRTTPIPVRARVYVDFESNDRVEVQVIDSNETVDLAVLRLANPTDKRKALTLRSPTQDIVGQPAYAIGYPAVAEKALPINQYGLNDSTISTGTISRLIQQSGTGRNLVQTDAEFTNGNSGGPLVVALGNVVGVTTISYSNNETDNLAFAEADYAVSADEVMVILNRNGIPYSTYDPDAEADAAAALVEEEPTPEPTEEPTPEPAPAPELPLNLIAIAAVAVVAVIAVVAIVAAKGKKRKEATPAVPVTPIAPVAPLPAAKSYDSGYRIQGSKGALAGQRFMLRTDGRLTLGRNAGLCNVVFPDGTPGVSGVHCAVWFEGGKIYLRDENSSHGTFTLAGTRLTLNQIVELRAGDGFYLGSPEQSFTVVRKGGI